MTVSSFGLNHIIMAFILPQFLNSSFLCCRRAETGHRFTPPYFPLTRAPFLLRRWHLRAGEAETLRQRLGDEPVGQTAAQAYA